MSNKSLVLDANILIRAVLGTRVRQILETHSERVTLFVPETAYAEAEEHLEALILQRRGNVLAAHATLRSMAALCTVVGLEIYEKFESESRLRMGARDPEDWPILAAALALECPIWTEDTDFFGCGIATWTTAGIERYLTA